MDTFPPNSKTTRSEPQEEKKLKRLTSADPIRRKKGLGKQFRETFVVGDARTATHYVLFDVLIPAAKDALADAFSQGIEKLIFGESRHRRGMRTPSSGATGYVNYNRMSRPDDRPPMPNRGMSKRARSRHDFDEIVLESRSEAEEVIDGLFEVVSRYGQASVADLYDLTGLESTHIDHKWGWTDLRGATVSRLRNSGYLLDLPETESLG